MFCWRLMTMDTIWAYVLDSPRQGADIVSRMWPPRFGYLLQLWAPLWATINMATLGTLLAIVLALPFAFLSAIKTTPNRYLVRSMALLGISASRSIN
jgi:phosphonate transport system permease protein